MDDLDFTEEEIREQLENLGYKNVSESRLKEFKRDLERLVQHERSKNSSCSTAATETADSSAGPQYEGRSNGQFRHPLNDAGNVHSSVVNQSSHDHTKYGKENSTRPNGQERNFSNRINIPRATYHIGGVPLSHYKEEIGYGYGPTDTTFDTTASSDRRMIKRKTVRKRDGHSVYEESMLDSEIDDVSSVQDAMERLRIPENSQEPSTAPSHQATCRRPVSARSEPVYRLPDDYEGPTALIRPMTANPHTRNIKKSDPVSRYQQYRASWVAQRAPGEKSHKSLRWNVREHMLHHDEVVEKKQHKVSGPNKFVIPSDKKRKNLRWQIRQDLAQGVMPPSIFE